MTKKVGVLAGASIVTLAAVALMVFAAPGVAAGDIAIGSKMPDFTMKDYTGKEHSLSDHQGEVVALIMVSQHCPWSRGADSDLAKISKQYQQKGVVFLGIDSHKSTPPADIQEYAEGKIPHPILKDTYNDYADLVGATRTPEIYIVDKDGTLVYHGAFDNRNVPEESGDVNYVTKALDEVLAGKPVTTTEKAAWGCSIKRYSAKEKADLKASTD